MTCLPALERPPGFPFRCLLSDFKYGCMLNVFCALVVTFGLNAGRFFVENLVISMSIGTVIFLLIDGVRLAIWGETQRPPKLAFYALVAVAVPLGLFGGTALATWLTGIDAGPDISLSSARTTSMLALTLLAALGGSVFFSGRQRIIRLQAEAAQEKARSESIARQAMQAQLQLLQAQIEPHMLFNTLANLQGLIGLDPPRAQLLLDQLIHYLRATLSSSRAETTTLGQEFALIDAYLGLMAVRMGARLAHRCDLPDALRDTAVPPMLLQPLVENALRHGLEPKLDGGRIDVVARREGASLMVRVSDDGLGLRHPGQPGGRVGLANIRDRLRAIYADGAALALTDGADGGAVATLTLPMANSR